MKMSKSLFLFIAASLAASSAANAHIVALGWKILGGGVVEFSAMHWHGNHETAGELIFDGVSYPFTSVTWNTPVLTGFNGALVNSEYATWDGAGTITSIAGEDNWLHVKISGVGPGSHTVTADSGPGQLTEWTLDGDVSTFDFVFTGGDTERLLSSTLRMTSIALSRTMTRDVGSRLFRLRSGLRPETATSPPPTASGSKAAPHFAPSETCRWEAYGQIYSLSESQEAQHRMIGGFRTMTHARTDLDILGATVGAEYDFDSVWAAGFAFSAADTEIRLRGAASGTQADVDSWALIPYVSYVQEAMGGAFYADLLYAYSDHEYDTRVGPLRGSLDGTSHQLDLNMGINFATPAVVHGPFAGLRWLDGKIDRSSLVGGSDTDYESLATQLGYQASFPIKMDAGTLVPQVRAAWEHEFESDQGNLGGVALGSLPEDVAVLGAGIGYYTPCGWNVVLDYEARLASEVDSHYVALKVGKEF